MRLAALTHLRYDSADELEGSWTRLELLEMHEHFVAAMEQAFELGLESRESAAAQVRLPANGGPRFVAPLCPVVRDALWRSSPPSEAVFVRR